MHKHPFVAHALLLTFGFDAAYAATGLRSLPRKLPTQKATLASAAAEPLAAPDITASSNTAAQPVGVREQSNRRRGLPPAFTTRPRARAD